MKQHCNGLVGGCLELAISLVDVLRLHWGSPFFRRIEEPSLSLPLLFAAPLRPSTASLLAVFPLLDLQSLLGEGLDYLECKKAEDVDNIIIGLRIGHHAKPSPLPETSSLAVSERRLPTLRPEDIFLLRHMLSPLVRRRQSLEGRVVLLFLLLVLLVISFGDLDRVEAIHVPNEADPGPLVFGFRRDVLRPCNDAAGANGVIGGGEIGRIAAAFLVRVFDVLAHVFPREEGLQARNFGFVVSDEEDEVVGGNRAHASSCGQRRAPGDLFLLAVYCSDRCCRLTNSMTCCRTISSIRLVVSSDGSAVSPETNIIWGN
jgi:hypothetical protein